MYTRLLIREIGKNHGIRYNDYLSRPRTIWKWSGRGTGTFTSWNLSIILAVGTEEQTVGRFTRSNGAARLAEMYKLIYVFGGR